jgi:hypothetical protein
VWEFDWHGSLPDQRVRRLVPFSPLTKPDGRSRARDKGPGITRERVMRDQERNSSNRLFLCLATDSSRVGGLLAHAAYR